MNTITLDKKASFVSGAVFRIADMEDYIINAASTGDLTRIDYVLFIEASGIDRGIEDSRSALYR